MGFDPVTMAATISKLTKSGQIGGETTKAVEVLPPTDVEFAETEGGIIGMISIYAFADNALADIIDNAKTVTVNFDGVDYTSKFLRDEGSGFAMGGNLALAGMGEDTGEPFFFLGTEDDPYNLTVLGIAAGTYTISIYDKTETIKPIDPKYLPPDVLPRVELSEETATTLLGAGVATLNAAEAATLDNMASNATPFLICAKMQGMTLVNGLMQYVLTNDTFSPMYVGILPYNYRNGSSISLEVYNIRKDGDSWTVDTKRVVVTP